MFLNTDWVRLNKDQVVLFIVGCFVLSSSWVVWSVTYSVFFHPLSSFPGPTWGRFTRIPFWISSIMRNQAEWMLKLHEKYGPVVRISPNELSYTDAQAWKDIYGYQKGRDENAKPTDFHFEEPTPSASLIIAGPTQHARIRRIFSPGFSDRALKEQEPMFQKYANLLASKMHTLTAGGKPVDMTVMTNLATFDVMAELALGESLGLLDNSKYTEWVHRVITSVQAMPYLQIIRYYPLLDKVFGVFGAGWMKEMVDDTMKYTGDRVDKRMERGSTQPDLWNLVQVEGDDDQLSREEMHSNALLFMVAGSETTATLLTSLVYLLLEHPASMQLLQAEIRGQAAAPAGLTFETLAGLKYLNACIQEGLRFYPPVPLGSPRIISQEKDGGQLISGRWVPSGTRVNVHQYAASHSAANFRAPEEFHPERWLGDELYEEDKRDARQPFSLGPRNCLGQAMAMHEMRIMLGTLVAEFDMELCAESKDWVKDRKVSVLWEKVSLMVRLTPVTK